MKWDNKARQTGLADAYAVRNSKLGLERIIQGYPSNSNCQARLRQGYVPQQSAKASSFGLSALCRHALGLSGPRTCCRHRHDLWFKDLRRTKIVVRRRRFVCLRLEAPRDRFQCALNHRDTVRGLRLCQSESFEHPTPAAWVLRSKVRFSGMVWRRQ